MDYGEALNCIEELGKTGICLGLDAVREVLSYLGDPEDTVPAIHIAGTNGKGSILAYLEACLMEAGLRVSKYTSPAVFEYRERFTTNREYISETEFAELLSKVKEAMKACKVTLSVFEAETVLFFLYAKRHADIMLMETGMGGRLDATNVIKKPLVTVLASISMDHMQYLGDTIEEIAREKCGILREGVPCVSSPANSYIEGTIKECCGDIKAPYICPEAPADISMQHGITTFSYEGEAYSLPLLGSYQAENAVTAMVALREAEKELLKRGGHILSISEDIIREGLAKTEWNGRLQRVLDEPEFYLDGAHNIDACKRLSEFIKSSFTNREIIYIIGVLKDKEYEKMMAELVPLAREMIIVTPKNARGLKGEELLKVCDALKSDDSVLMHEEDDIGNAAILSIEIAKKYKAPVIISWGSLSYMGEIRKALTIINRNRKP